MQQSTASTLLYIPEPHCFFCRSGALGPPSGSQSVSPVHAFHRDSIRPSSSVGVKVLHVHPVTGICRRGNSPTFPKGARLNLGLFCPVKDTGVVILALGGKLRCFAVKLLSAQRQAYSLLACWLALHPKTLRKAFLASQGAKTTLAGMRVPRTDRDPTLIVRNAKSISRMVGPHTLS